MAHTNLTHKRQFAAFDVDWTMHPSALGTNFIQELLREGVISADFNIEDTYRMWQQNPREIFMSHYHGLFKQLLGLKKDVLQGIADTVGTNASANIYPFISSEIERHRRDNKFLMLISNSPTIVVRPFAAQLGFDEVSGGDFEFNSNNELIDMKSTSKRPKSGEVKRIMKQYNLELVGSYAYGDSVDDISMLEIVENPVTVSPTDDLRARAIQSGWRITDVR